MLNEIYTVQYILLLKINDNDNDNDDDDEEEQFWFLYGFITSFYLFNLHKHSSIFLLKNFTLFYNVLFYLNIYPSYMSNKKTKNFCLVFYIYLIFSNYAMVNTFSIGLCFLKKKKSPDLYWSMIWVDMMINTSTKLKSLCMFSTIDFLSFSFFHEIIDHFRLPAFSFFTNKRIKINKYKRIHFYCTVNYSVKESFFFIKKKYYKPWIINYTVH